MSFEEEWTQTSKHFLAGESKVSLRDQLVTFITEKIESMERDMDFELNDKTSLIRSGLFDSLALLHLTAWIEEQSYKTIDLSKIDIMNEWDTIERILDFIQRQRES
jgi:acyl carrier protein